MITIETWPKETWPDGTLALKASTFIRHNGKRVDPWFSRYVQGIEKPNYPMPAIPLAVKYDYLGCVNIDDVSDPDDPIIVYLWDSWCLDSWRQG